MDTYSLRNKFEQLSAMADRNMNIFFISETKLSETLPAALFSLRGIYKPYRFDRNRNGDGILYVREDISSRFLEIKFRNKIEYFFV